ncbi:protein CDV3 homolog isoform X3 [Myotis daubentonii]|uniref:protein CDV3 homolog isoform X3 n=1 Tax=Myotis daubentonii TaxID=98922 RepID=UPI002872BBEA|nr:protein CDV3 homolog isoform X3 [Myotis daubentonii]
MAETEERSLDNFFAKRDKKKKKERSNRAASAAGATGAAGGSSGAAGAAGSGAGVGARPGDGGTAGAAGSGAATKTVTKDEDEWKEFEQKEVDYSGLRVQAMQISEKEEDDSEKREDPGDNWEEGGGGGGGVEKSSGPWNKTAPVQAPPAPVVVTETPEPAMTSGVYRPPGARLTTTRKTPQGPPEIYSDTQFPSLQSTAKHVESRNRYLK